ncbi:ATP-binding protein [Tepidiforma sp.]|uniref:AAA family ATPase n=1 Tax=Tepidiforma sp. TaxID=2682230 RepID=UPI002ADD613E|nr:ATP-binding protein [Tepidiforma sp.]
MNPTLEALSIAVQARVPVLLWGPPGTGKSSTVRKLGESLCLPVETVIASIREPSDFAGLPVVGEGCVTFAPPSWATRLAKAGEGILFLDELTTAPPAVQAALLRVALERTVGDLELPPGVAVVAAANPPDQAAGGWELSLPLANRFLHLERQLSAAAWVSSMASGWKRPAIRDLPASWNAARTEARRSVAAFIDHRPDLLLKLPNERAQQHQVGAWPSPRSWEMLATALGAAWSVNASAAAVEKLVIGAIGAPAAREFLEGLRTGFSWDAADILRHPDRFTLPSRPDALLALLDAVCVRVIEGLPTPQGDALWDAGWQVLARVAKRRGADVA